MCAWRRLASRLKCNKQDYSPRRWLTHGALALAAGIFMGYRAGVSIWWPLAAAFGLLLTLMLHRMGKRVYPGVMLCFFFVGMTVCAHHAHPQLPPEGKYQINATAVGEAVIREEDTRVALYLKDAVLQGEDGKTYTVDKLYWTYWPEEEDTLPPYDGQQVCFTGKVYHPSGRENPYGFDFRMYLLQKGVTAGVSGAKELSKLPEEQTMHKSLILRLRKGLSARIEALFGDQAPLMKALLIGQTEGMPEEMREGFRKAGVAHVLSVSGLHAMLIMGFVIRCLERIHASPRVVFGVTGILLTIYSLLVGAGAPILRAAVLVGYQLYAHMVRRRGDQLTALSLGFILILIFQPLQLFAAGFQMSFSAVLGMVMLGDALHPLLLRIRSKKLHRVCSAYAVTLCATTGVMLPVIYTYNYVSLIGFLVNPLVCLMTEGMMLFGIGILLLSCISLPIARELGAIAAHLSRFMVESVGWAGNVSWASVRAFTPPWYLTMAVVLCLLLCTRYVRLKKLFRFALGSAALVLACAVMLLLQNHDVRFVQLSMGDADAAVIEDGRETVVIDTGEYGGDLSSYLLATGREVDHLLLTHLHSDHALGLQKLLDENVPIRQMYLSTEAMKTDVSNSVAQLLMRAREMGIPLKLLCAGDQIKTARVTIDVLWPEEGSGHAIKDPNDCAMALGISLYNAYLLHMSDIPGTYEKYVSRPTDILRAAHHGSDKSTKEDFLDGTQPQICIISGDDPAESTLSRLAHSGAMVYDTGRYGAVTVTVREGQYFVEGYLQ